MKILMVCLGNICRSPMAEGIMQHLIDKKSLHWQVESAGTNRFHTGEAPHRSSIKVCAENGIDITKQRARTFVAMDMRKYDLILALATDVLIDIKGIAKEDYDYEKVFLLTEFLYPKENKSIVDPWYGTEDGYYPVFDEIKKCCEAMLNEYGG